MSYTLRKILIKKQYTFLTLKCVALMVSWLVLGFKTNCPFVGPGSVGGVPSMGGGLSKGSKPVFTRISEKTMENSERLIRQERPGLNLLDIFLAVIIEQGAQL